MNALDFDRQLLWRFRAKLVRIVDGDSCVVLCDTGFFGRQEVSLRLADYSAPERYEADGPAATAALAEAIATGVGEWPLRVVTLQRETVVREVQSFARYVGHLWLVNADGTLTDVRERLP